jgi:elongation factor 1-beta
LFVSLSGRKQFPQGSGDAKPAAAPAAKPAADDDDEDVDLFGSDEEDEEAERVKQERLAVSFCKIYLAGKCQARSRNPG